MYFRYPTPCITINTKTIASNYCHLKNLFPNFRIAYSIKANPNIKILQTLLQNGAYFEVASYGEMKILENISTPYEKIIFSNPIKSKEFIQRIANSNGKNSNNYYKFLVVDSIAEIIKIKEYKNKNMKILLRLAVSNIGSKWPLSHKFGIDLNELMEFIHVAKENQIEIDGFTFHVGSQNTSIQAWKWAMKKVYKAKAILEKNKIPTSTLNIGGGFSTDMLYHKKKQLENIANFLQNSIQGKFDTLYMEPGRYLVANAGKLYSRVVGIAYRKKKKWAYLDSGIFQGLFEAMEGILYPCKNLSYPNGKIENVILAGPSCDSLDIVGTFQIEELRINDLVCFSCTGAYTNVYASNFNGLKKPVVISQ